MRSRADYVSMPLGGVRAVALGLAMALTISCSILATGCSNSHRVYTNAIRPVYPRMTNSWDEVSAKPFCPVIDTLRPTFKWRRFAPYGLEMERLTYELRMAGSDEPLGRAVDIKSFGITVLPVGGADCGGASRGTRNNFAVCKGITDTVQ